MVVRPTGDIYDPTIILNYSQAGSIVGIDVVIKEFGFTILNAERSRNAKLDFGEENA